MIPPESLAAFFLASVVLGLSPGPDNLFVMAQSLQQGRRAGLWVVLGLCSGLLVHTTAVALGVAALFQASAVAFTGLKLVGAAYLLYLAWQAFRADGGGQSGAVQALSGRALYRRGVIMNLTNPKVSIFFLAFLPQFAAPEQGPLAPQIMMLGAVFIAATILVFGGVALLAGSFGKRLSNSPGAQRLIHRLAGAVFVALALRLALAQR